MAHLQGVGLHDLRFTPVVPIPTCAIRLSAKRAQLQCLRGGSWVLMTWRAWQR